MERNMKVWGNWDDLVEKCKAQDEQLKKCLTSGEPCAPSWYDIISENLGFYDRLAKKNETKPPRG